MKIKNIDGLLVDEETNTCLNYLFVFQAKTFSPDGITQIPMEQVDAHNKALSAGEIAGLDACEVGQAGTFYYTKGQVKTFIGDIVASKYSVQISGQTITFIRGEKTFRGRLQKDADCFNFKRIK